MTQSFYEATAQERKLISVGREMMDYSEEYGKIYGLKAVTDDGFRTLNNLSHVGGMLTRFGTTFGTTAQNFTEEDRELIVAWMQKAVVIERKDQK